MLTDNEGSVRDVVQYSASGGTTPVDHLVYDAFGTITSQTPGAATPRFTYTGQMTDPTVEFTAQPGEAVQPGQSPATGLYYDGARWYDSGVGSFICQDPSGFAAGDANLYRYCGNDPVSETDPSGLSSSGQGSCGSSCQCGCQGGQTICLTTCYDGEDVDGDGPTEHDGVCHATYAGSGVAPNPRRRRTGRPVGMGVGRSTPYRRSAGCFWKFLKVAIRFLRRRRARTVWPTAR